jgi:hypothetical protein
MLSIEGSEWNETNIRDHRLHANIHSRVGGQRCLSVSHTIAQFHRELCVAEDAEVQASWPLRYRDIPSACMATPGNVSMIATRS